MTMCFKTIERCRYIQVNPQTKKRGATEHSSMAAEDLNRDTDRRYTVLQQRLEDDWSKYEANDITTSNFLKTVSHLYGFQTCKDFVFVLVEVFVSCAGSRQHVKKLCCVCFALY